MEAAVFSYLSSVFFTNDCFDRCMAIAQSRNLQLDEAVELLHAVVSPPSHVDWRLLGHPSGDSCQLMAKFLERLTAAIQVIDEVYLSEEIYFLLDDEVLQRWPKLFSVAVFYVVAPCSDREIFHLLSKAQLVARLKKFACILRRASLVG